MFSYHQLENLIEKNYYLHRSAKDAFRSYLQSYASHSLKNVCMLGICGPSLCSHAVFVQIYNVHKLDLQKVAKAFGLAVPPAVNLSMLGGASVESRGQSLGGQRKPKFVSLLFYLLFYLIQLWSDLQGQGAVFAALPEGQVRRWPPILAIVLAGVWLRAARSRNSTQTCTDRQEAESSACTRHRWPRSGRHQRSAAWWPVQHPCTTERVRKD